jgi:glucokinase
VSTALGIDLGATQIKAAIFDPDGRCQNRWVRETKDTGDAQAFIAHATELMRLVGPVDHVGLAAPGLAASDGRSISHMPGRLDGLAGFDWTSHWARSVHVLNDAHAAILGEAWQGAARGLNHVVMLTLGTGVGGAILVEGRLLRGAIGRAGHLGHMTVDARGKPDIVGTPGSLEDAIGNCTVSQRSAGRFSSSRDLVEAVQLGDEYAREVWLTSVQAVGAAVASLINVLDPEAIVIGGGIAKAAAVFFEPLARVLDATEWRPDGRRVAILPAQLDEWAGAFGAARHALDHP